MKIPELWTLELVFKLSFFKIFYMLFSLKTISIKIAVIVKKNLEKITIFPILCSNGWINGRCRSVSRADSTLARPFGPKNRECRVTQQQLRRRKRIDKWPATPKNSHVIKTPAQNCKYRFRLRRMETSHRRQPCRQWERIKLALTDSSPYRASEAPWQSEKVLLRNQKHKNLTKIF